MAKLIVPLTDKKIENAKPAANTPPKYPAIMHFQKQQYLQHPKAI